MFSLGTELTPTLRSEPGPPGAYELCWGPGDWILPTVGAALEVGTLNVTRTPGPSPSECDGRLRSGAQDGSTPVRSTSHSNYPQHVLHMLCLGAVSAN